MNKGFRFKVPLERSVPAIPKAIGAACGAATSGVTPFLGVIHKEEVEQAQSGL
jgi:hypothetical protein